MSLLTMTRTDTGNKHGGHRNRTLIFLSLRNRWKYRSKGEWWFFDVAKLIGILHDVVRRQPIPEINMATILTGNGYFSA